MSGLLRQVALEEEACRRLAREIHDGYGQRVAALGFEIHSIRKGMIGADPQSGRLDLVAERLVELGEDLHRLSHELHPAVLEHRGLVVALRDVCAEFEERQGLPIELDLSVAEHPIPAEVALGIFRIAQEGLANVMRHGAARSVRLALSVGSNTVRLLVSDDGTGFDPDSVDSGLGLASMRERAQLLGGRCRIVSSPGAGTRITISVPRRRLGRWMRRRWRWLATVALIVLSLGGGLTATLLQMRQTSAAAKRAEAAVHFLEGLFVASDPRRAQGEIPDARELLRRGTEQLDHELADQPLLRAKLLDTLGGIHTELGLYDEAGVLLEEALALRQRLRGPHHPEVGATLVRLGALAHYSGKGDAEAYFRQALALQERRGAESPELADVLNKLGASFGAQGRFDEAAAVLQRSLRVHERVYGSRDPRVAKVLHNLSGIAFYRDDLEAAEVLLQRAVEIREATLEEGDLELAGSREALALLRRRQGRTSEAADLLEALAVSAEGVYGPEHPQLARTLMNLGLARDELGEADVAGQLLERALAICEKALAAEHPQHLRAMAMLANHHLRQGHHAEATMLYRRLLELRESGATFAEWDEFVDQWEELQVAQ